jgi:predicted SAM-dependent methyltransferase
MGSRGTEPEDLSALATLSRYLESLEAPAQGGVLLRGAIKQWMTTAVLPVERMRARRRLASQAPCLLHLGCADNYIDGWLNIDLFRPGRRLDLRWDLRRPLPFPDGAVDAIFTEHMLEHMTFTEALGFLGTCTRLLGPGGVLRIGVPDLQRYIRSYEGRDPLIADVRPGRPTTALAFCEVFYGHGHRSMYDFATLRALCAEVGFAQIEQSAFGEGLIQPCPDNPARRAETLYVEARV